jgi:phenylalanyl-tRNA synthetase alpha chain
VRRFFVGYNQGTSNMNDRLEELRNKALKELEEVRDRAELELARVKHLGRKSELNELLKGLKDKAEEERKRLGPLLQNARKEMEERFADIADKISSVADRALEPLDVTAPGLRRDRGHVHLLSQVQEDMNHIFSSMGFDVLEGPEVESAWHNFDALNIPEGHPARDMMDTFWLKGQDNLLMRTHTSPMQARYMQTHQPPFRIVVPGRVYRNEATDATHEFQFHQIEGLMVSRQASAGSAQGAAVSLANLKGVMEHFFRKFFRDDEVKIRFVASYFPFVEPGVGVYIQGTKGRLAGKWIEVAGAGMVHQEVFKAVGYVPGEFQGFAFGMALERMTMLRHRVDDIRLFHGGAIRFLRQF